MNTATTSTSISESINFVLDSETDFLKEKLGAEIDNFSNSEDFRNAHIVFVEINREGKHLQNAYGVDLAIEVVRKDPQAKVILLSTLDFSIVRKLNKKVDLVLKYENVRFQHTGQVESLSEVFNQKKPEYQSMYLASEEAQRYVGKLHHDIRKVDNWQNPIEVKEDRTFRECMKKAKDYFPSLVDVSDEEIVTFLIEAFSQMRDREEVMKGQRIDGVYCDVEGTLLVDGQINEKVALLLREYSLQGKELVIWTDGDIDELMPKLHSLGFMTTVKSKRDYAGAIAEIVIDDLDEFAFSGLTKISAEKFIRASDL